MFSSLFNKTRLTRTILLLGAILIALASLAVSHFLIKDLSREEQSKMEIWAEAMRSLVNANENTDLNLVLKVINGNNTIPVIVMNGKGEVASYRNLSVKAQNHADSLTEIKAQAAKMIGSGRSMTMKLSDDEAAGNTNAAQGEIVICYGESILLRKMAYYPYVQLIVVILFVCATIYALLSSARSERNRVWVGLSKETAHQLGTPISSLMAWVEVLRESYPNDKIVPEINKDVERLELVAERFSKIGSYPELKITDLRKVVERTYLYLARRASSSIKVCCDLPQSSFHAEMNAPLFEWVLENLGKNAIDAMPRGGSLTIKMRKNNDTIYIYVSDTGKGISKKNFKNVFKPGFTTKKRGWGLGLSLAKRIVEDYHKGKIYVKQSIIDKGTTFCIELNNCDKQKGQ